MARYENEYLGYYSDAGRARGADPNHRGGNYRGMRTWGGEGQAPYGAYRMRHPQDFEGSGGRYGRYGGGPAYSTEFENAYGGYVSRGYDREWQGGGVHDPRYDVEYLRDFNAYSPRFRGYDRDQMGGRSRYDLPYGGHAGDQLSARYRNYRIGYANRGLSSGGYSEGWAWGPMRGAR